MKVGEEASRFPGGSTFEFDPTEPGFLADPYPTYRRLRAESPAYYMKPHQLWAVTRYDDVFGALTNPAVWSSAKGNVVIDSTVRVGRTLGTLDPPRHDELRKIVSKGVSPARVKQLSIETRQYVKDTIDSLISEDEFDIVGNFARPILNRSLARLVGLDEKSSMEVDAMIEAALDTSAAVVGPVGRPDAGAQLFRYLMDRILERSDDRTAATDDFLSVLIAARNSGAPLENEEIAANMMTVLLAGSASVVHFFGNLIHALYLHPEQKLDVLADNSLLDSAIEETARWDTSTQCFARFLTKDTNISSTTIPAGARVLLFLGSASRDERVFDRPEIFDIHRKRVRHLGFGAGPHQCLGSFTAWQLCKVLLEETLPVLGDFDINLDAAERVRFIMFRGFKHLPCRPRPTRGKR